MMIKGTVMLVWLCVGRCGTAVVIVQTLLRALLFCHYCHAEITDLVL